MGWGDGTTLDPETLALIDSVAERIARRGDGAELALDLLASGWPEACARFEAELDLVLASECRTLCARLEAIASQITRVAGLGAAVHGTRGEIILAWAESSAASPDLALAPMFAHAALSRPPRLARAVRARVLRGPVRDALSCLHLADEALGSSPRVELLLWEAGAGALSIPEVGAWLGRGGAAYDGVLLAGARGSLRRRVLAARALAVAADGLASRKTEPRVAATTVRLVRALAGHPEPLVWIPAARAMGRLAPTHPPLRSAILEWLDSDNKGEHRRAITALASTPAEGSLDSLLTELLEKSSDPWAVAAIGPALPHVVADRRHLWDGIARALRTKDPGPQVLWSIASGLLTLARGDELDSRSEAALRTIREKALSERPPGVVDALLWRQIRVETDFMDGLEPDATDPDRMLDRMVATALTKGARSVTERAKLCARSIEAHFAAALPTAGRGAPVDERAASLAILESCGRAAALSLWEPLMGCAGSEPEAATERARAARAFMTRQMTEVMRTPEQDFPLHRAALRVLGYVADATEAPRADEPSSERGRAAATIIVALEAAPWLSDRRTANEFKKSVGDALWRVLDSARRAAAPPADPLLLPRFYSWWALATEVPDRISLLSRSEAAVRTEGSERALASAKALRAALDPSSADALAGGWGGRVSATFAELGVSETELERALATLGSALFSVDRAQRVPTAGALRWSVSSLAEAAHLVRAAVGDPDRALGSPVEPAGDALTEYAELIAETIAVRTRHVNERSDLDLAQRWCAGLGPVIGPLVSRAVAELARAHAGRDCKPATARRRIGQYELLEWLGGGAFGDVWRVANASGVHFVLKIIKNQFGVGKAEDRAVRRASLEREAAILKTLHHANLATLVDHGWEGEEPYLVMPLLVGADLEAYSQAKRLSLDECKPIVKDVCAGLRALHRRGLVHRDLKPGNIFLELDLGREGKFDGSSHRDPRHKPIDNVRVIDLGIARRFTNETGRPDATVEGTPGFIAPEQAMGSSVLGGRTDVYALAATVYAVMTGHTFFEEQTDTNANLLAHATREPLASPAAVRGLPGPMLTLLRDATRLDPMKRPDLETFGRRFATL